MKKRPLKITAELLSLTIFGVLILTPPSSLCVESTAEIYLAPGEQKSVPCEKISRIAIGNRNTVDVKFPKNRKSILVIAKKVGISNIIYWDKNLKNVFLVRVIPAGLKGLFTELKKTLKEIEGVHLNILGDKILIEGSVYKAQDKNKISSLANSSEHIVDLVRINLEMLPLTASLIRRELTANGFPQIKVRPRGEKIFLNGEVYRKQDLQSVLEISKSIFPNIVHSIDIAVEMEKMIMIDLKIAEIRKNLSKALGIKWQDNIRFNANYTKSTGGTVGTISFGEGFNSTLNLLETKGLVRILSNPKLVCKNGKKGRFQSGGEIPIRLIGERTTDIRFKNYGLILEVTPKVDALDNVAVEINSEVSDINMAATVEGIPGFLKNSLETQINIRAGDTIILAGLIENKASKGVDKFPLLGHIPILGELFKSRNFTDNKSEFAVFITPTLIRPDSPRNKKELDLTEEELRKAKKNLKAKIMD